jgi:lipoprotein-anchoring transpeptidase ErfK/SrfK
VDGRDKPGHDSVECISANSFPHVKDFYARAFREPLDLSVIFPTKDGGGTAEGTMSRSVGFAALMAAVALSCGTANADPLPIFSFLTPPSQTQVAPQAVDPAPLDERDDAKVDPRLQRQTVGYTGHEAAGTIIIDTPHTFLYYVLGNGKAIRYGIGVGREGFTWSGVKSITRKSEWPDWYPPAQMVARQPYLPRMVAGGPGNPLGARAMYIGGTEYRIHGTNDPSSIGKHVSSGCIRMTNANVIDLFSRVQLGAKVVVLPAAAVAEMKAFGRPEQASAMESYASAPQGRRQSLWISVR